MADALISPAVGASLRAAGTAAEKINYLKNIWEDEDGSRNHETGEIE
jgi:hypothetical protein